jgi:hypothetical protein
MVKKAQPINMPAPSCNMPAPSCLQDSDNDLPDKTDSTKYVLNQLHFRTNSNTIIPYLKAKTEIRTGHSRFSLNSIIKLPSALISPLNDPIVRLSLMNSAVPILDESVKAVFLTYLSPDYTGKQPQALIIATIDQIRIHLQTTKVLKPELEALNRAVGNYENFGFFSQIDWCLDHWGTTEDIQDLTESTFDLPTTRIEFQTIATPPIIALQFLANTFPSVLFTLQYRLVTENNWNEVQLYPFPPFGY